MGTPSFFGDKSKTANSESMKNKTEAGSIVVQDYEKDRTELMFSEFTYPMRLVGILNTMMF